MNFSFLYSLPFPGLILAFLAGLCVAIANLCMRKSLDVGRNTNGYLLLRLFTACLLAVFINPVAHEAYSIDATTAFLGLFAGLFLAIVMIAMGQAMATGPAGLSVAFINSSSVVPPALLAWIFGAHLGFIYGFREIFGSALVVIGLFWASTTTLKTKKPTAWAKAICLVFFAHVLLLMTFQYRSLLLRVDTPIDGFLIHGHINMSQSYWFLPLMFGVAFLIQLRFCLKEARFPNWKEAGLGIIGGILNGLSVVFINEAAQVSIGSNQIALIFPLYSVSILFICSLWSQYLYKESIKWMAIAMAIVGIALGMT